MVPAKTGKRREVRRKFPERLRNPGVHVKKKGPEVLTKVVKTGPREK